MVLLLFFGSSTFFAASSLMVEDLPFLAYYSTFLSAFTVTGATTSAFLGMMSFALSFFLMASIFLGSGTASLSEAVLSVFALFDTNGYTAVDYLAGAASLLDDLGEISAFFCKALLDSFFSTFFGYSFISSITGLTSGSAIYFLSCLDFLTSFLAAYLDSLFFGVGNYSFIGVLTSSFAGDFLG